MSYGRMVFRFILRALKGQDLTSLGDGSIMASDRLLVRLGFYKAMLHGTFSMDVEGGSNRAQ